MQTVRVQECTSIPVLMYMLGATFISLQLQLFIDLYRQLYTTPVTPVNLNQLQGLHFGIYVPIWCIPLRVQVRLGVRPDSM